MAFQQVTVENRVSEFPNRRTLTKEDNTTEIVTVTRNEGNVSTEGTAWGAAYANDLESRINTETNLLETNFGHVETNTTASKSYSVGETLVLNGQMYKVTAAIAQGATLTVGTNIAVHSVSAINSNIKVYVGSDDKLHFVNGLGADSALPFSSYKGYTLPMFQLLSTYTSTDPFTSAYSDVWIPLVNAKGISLTYSKNVYNDVTATLVDNNDNHTIAFSQTGRSTYNGSYTNNSLNKNYKWLAITVSANGAATNIVTIGNVNVTA